MYERLDKGVERVLKKAHDIAQEYDQEYVGTEHILLAICRENSSLAATILNRRGASPEKMKQQIDLLIQQSMEETWVLGRLPGTPHFKNVIAQAIEAARQLESKDVRTEHLLLALLKEKGSVAYNALKNLGIKISDIRKDVAKNTA